MNEKIILAGVIILILIELIKSMAFFIKPIAMLKRSVEYHTESARSKKRTLLNIKNGKLSIVLLRGLVLIAFIFFALALKVLLKFV